MREIRKEQVDFLNWELGAFFHFGIRTFYEGHEDWDMKEMPAEAFNPAELDCRQWISGIKEAGANYAILVCKHHDGFANWPSKYTDYSVANTPWRNGKGDVVKDFTEACREYGIKVGLYYSPAEFGSDTMDWKEYDDYLWFDGCGSENHKYDTERILGVIKGLQPEILLFNMLDPDTKWVGNEAGMVKYPNDNWTSDLDFSILTAEKEQLKQKKFLPAECNSRIRLEKWFFSETDAHTLKSVDELLGLYYLSVGRGANMLVNITPDRRGLLPERDIARFIEFGKKVKSMFAESLISENDITKEENTYQILFDEHTLVNHVILEEDLLREKSIEKFGVYVHPYPYGERILVYEGKTVGRRHICKFPTVRARQLDIVIESDTENMELNKISAYYVK